jgi:hypothetical protein
MFLALVAQWLRPERLRLWPAAIRAAIAALRDPGFGDLPGLIAELEPALAAAPEALQSELEALLVALHAASPTETAFLVRQVLSSSPKNAAALVFRRMSPALPPDLQQEIRELI